MPSETPVQIVQQLTESGYNAEREAVTLLAGADDVAATLSNLIEQTPSEQLRITTADVRTLLDNSSSTDETAVVTQSRETDSSTPEDERSSSPPDSAEMRVSGDITGESTGTGEYRDFVSLFRARYNQ